MSVTLPATIDHETPTVVTTPTAPTDGIPQPHWGATRLKSVLLCPRQFRYAYVDLIPSVPTAPLVFGRVLHETLRFIHEWQMSESCLPHAGEALLRFDTLWQQALAEEEPFFRAGAPGAEQHTRLGHEILRAYLEVNKETPAPLAAELEFEIKANGQVLRGVIDRIDEAPEGLIIVDFKSGKRKLTPQEVERDLQLTVYAFAAEQIYGRSVAQVAQYYLRDGTYIPALRGPDDYAWLLDEIMPHARRVVNESQYPPRVGYWCNWCDYKELCRAERSCETARARDAEPVGGEPNGLRDSGHN